MDDDECPDSTVLIDEEDDEEPMVADNFPHHIGGGRRRLMPDEPQSSRISSTGLHFNPSNFPVASPMSQLPPLPKLIFRPPTHAGHYHSVSFSSSTNPSRLGGVTPSPIPPSRSDNLIGSRLTPYASSRSESFPGTRVNLNAQSRGEIVLPVLSKMEPISRSELTISRVGTSSTATSNSRLGLTSSGTRTEIPIGRVGGVSISRVKDSSVFQRSPSTSTAKHQNPFGRLPGTIHRLPLQADAVPSRKFGRRFLKATTSHHKPQLQPRPQLPVRRASEDYMSTGMLHQTEDPLAMDTDIAIDYVSPNRPMYSATSTSFSNATSTTILGAETLTSHQGSQGIKLHISKKPVEVIEVDDSSSERSSNSFQNNSDSNIGGGFGYLSPTSVNISANNSSSSVSIDELPMPPVKLKVQLKKEKIKIPSDIIITEAVEDDDDDGPKDDLMILSETIPGGHGGIPFMQRLTLPIENRRISDSGNISRRTRRKRVPVPVATEVPPKVRRRRGAPTVAISPENGQETSPPLPIVVDAATPASSPSVARGRGSGRGRGRPRGSTNKAKMEKQQQLLQLSTPPEIVVKEEHSENESPQPDTTVFDTTTPEALPLEGDAEVNAEVSSAETPTKRSRGRGRGSAISNTPGTPRSSRARGTRGTRSQRGSKKSPEGKKIKAEKKETIKAPPPVQLFEEETRMSADIKPPFSDRITGTALATPIVLDEESRASNVSSTSTSTTAKAKRFTKDPIEERKPVTSETLFEYQWPLDDKNAEFYFLQEQISEFLGVKSFKRKYPDIRRRVVDMQERDYLRNSKVVSETQCDLGLTAVHSCDVLDIMFNDFAEKYEEYRKVFQERKDQEMQKLKPGDGAEPSAVRDRSGEFMRRILNSCAKWNSGTNKDRMEERQCSFDLQTGTLHFPNEKLKTLPAECTKMGMYPVAVLPGQFTDDFKKYTPDELFYLPLNSVRYGPISENWIVNSDSSDESSDSDDSSSSGDSSSSSTDEDVVSAIDNDQNKVVLTDDSGNVLYRGAPGLTKISIEATCKSCDGDAHSNKDANPEVLLHCSRCDVANHPSCLELTLDMLPFITKYHWECTECKNCIECNDPADEDKMLFCDCCDRGYHIYCVGLRKVPNGRWHCSVCALCYSCGVTQPSPEDRMAEWHHEYRKGLKGVKFYHHSLCVACYKLYKRGQFCPSCLKVHSKLGASGLLECRKCEKWVHKECVKRPAKSMFGFMCDPCDAAFRSRAKLPSHVN